jgi:hypothetical protein
MTEHTKFYRQIKAENADHELKIFGFFLFGAILKPCAKSFEFARGFANKEKGYE